MLKQLYKKRKENQQTTVHNPFPQVHNSYWCHFCQRFSHSLLECLWWTVSSTANKKTITLKNLHKISIKTFILYLLLNASCDIFASKTYKNYIVIYFNLVHK